MDAPIFFQCWEHLEDVAYIDCAVPTEVQDFYIVVKNENKCDKGQKKKKGPETALGSHSPYEFKPFQVTGQKHIQPLWSHGLSEQKVCSSSQEKGKC